MAGRHRKMVNGGKEPRGALLLALFGARRTKTKHQARWLLDESYEKGEMKGDVPTTTIDRMHIVCYILVGELSMEREVARSETYDICGYREQQILFCSSVHYIDNVTTNQTSYAKIKAKHNKAPQRNKYAILPPFHD